MGFASESQTTSSNNLFDQKYSNEESKEEAKA